MKNRSFPVLSALIAFIFVISCGGPDESSSTTTTLARVATPVISPEGGLYTSAQSVELTAPEGTIYYTTDGSTPTTSSIEYSSALTLSPETNIIIKAMAAKTGRSNSAVVSSEYTITEDYSVSESGGEITITNYTGSGGDISIPAFINGYPVTFISNRSFYQDNSLTGVDIPDSVTTIGVEAFHSCGSLTNVTLPNSVTTICEGAFAYCPNLSSVTIPDSVTTIGEGAFYNCSSLSSVTVNATTPPTLGGSFVFDFNHTGRKFYVPSGTVSAYHNATYWDEYSADIVSQ